MDDALAGARAVYPDAGLEIVDRLAGGDRAEVLRVRVRQPDAEPQTVIVKSYVDPGEGWVRESAALSALSGRTWAAPDLLAATAEPPVVALADAGSGPSVADALLADDRAAAAYALGKWAESLAELHRSSAGLRAEFVRALDERAEPGSVADDPTGFELTDLARRVDDRCATLGVATSTAALEEIRDLCHRLDGHGAGALSPADTCPDNNVLAGERLVLIDFEGGQWRHVAWDLAYLRAPWPTCWCAWRVPDDVADAAVARYRSVAGPPFDAVSDADVDAAVLGWAFAAFEMFLNRALDGDQPLHLERPTPSRRATILHRLAAAGRNTELSAAAELAARLRAALVERWGEAELAYAPAFAQSGMQ